MLPLRIPSLGRQGSRGQRGPHPGGDAGPASAASVNGQRGRQEGAGKMTPWAVLARRLRAPGSTLLLVQACAGGQAARGSVGSQTHPLRLPLFYAACCSALWGVGCETLEK